MQEDERIGATNVAAAVRAIKHQGLFMMFDRDNTHYLATRQFFLKLRTRDAWRIQCRLEIEHRGRWYQKFEGNFYESDRKPEIEKFIEIYEGWLQRASVDIAPIGLTLEKFGARLFAGDGGYTAIDSELLAMVDIDQEETTIRRAGNLVIIDDTQVLGIINDEETRQNAFLVNIWAAAEPAAETMPEQIG